MAETLEDSSVLDIAPADILAALKKLAEALAAAEVQVASSELERNHAGQWQVGAGRGESGEREGSEQGNGEKQRRADKSARACCGGGGGGLLPRCACAREGGSEGDGGRGGNRPRVFIMKSLFSIFTFSSTRLTPHIHAEPTTTTATATSTFATVTAAVAAATITPSLSYLPP